MFRFKKCREEKGFSQKYVALTLGVKAPSVSDWENGKTNPTLDNLIAMSRLYMVSVDELLGLDNSLENGESAGYFTDSFTSDQLKLIHDYDDLNPQGREYIRQQMAVALQIYKKHPDFPIMEDANDQKIG